MRTLGYFVRTFRGNFAYKWGSIFPIFVPMYYVNGPLRKEFFSWRKFHGFTKISETKFPWNFKEILNPQNFTKLVNRAIKLGKSMDFLIILNECSQIV